MSVSETIVTGALVLIGILHLYPAVGMLSADRPASLYDTAPRGDLLILMRHRAVLFGLLAHSSSTPRSSRVCNPRRFWQAL